MENAPCKDKPLANVKTVSLKSSSIHRKILFQIYCGIGLHKQTDGKGSLMPCHHSTRHNRWSRKESFQHRIFFYHHLTQINSSLRVSCCEDVERQRREGVVTAFTCCRRHCRSVAGQLASTLASCWKCLFILRVTSAATVLVGVLAKGSEKQRRPKFVG